MEFPCQRKAISRGKSKQRVASMKLICAKCPLPVLSCDLTQLDYFLLGAVKDKFLVSKYSRYPHYTPISIKVIPIAIAVTGRSS